MRNISHVSGLRNRFHVSSVEGPIGNTPGGFRKAVKPPEVSVPPQKQRFLARKRCFCGGTETSGGLTALRNPPGVFPMGPSTEETWNRFRNPETWLMLRRKS